MKNLLNILWASTKIFGVVIVTGGITQHIVTYHLVKNKISKAEKEGKEYAISYCKRILRNSYKDSRLSRFVDGGDDAAKEYLELTELNK